MIVPRADGESVIPVLWSAVDDVLTPVNDWGPLANGFLMAAVAPVVGPDIERIELFVDGLREVGTRGFTVVQFAV